MPQTSLSTSLPSIMTFTLRRRQVLTGSSAAIAGVMAGCLSFASDDHVSGDFLGDDDASGEPGDPTGFTTVGIHAKPWFQFDPNLVHLRTGGTVKWVVVDDYRHTVASYHPETHRHQRIPDDAEPWHSGLLRDGSTFEHTFLNEGIYDYVDTRSLCSSH